MQAAGVEIVLEQFVYAFIALFVILDPFASIPPFFGLTRKMSDDQRKHIARKAVLVAGILAALFLVAGSSLLGTLGISLSSFKVAGGIVLGLMGLETVLNMHFGGASKPDQDSVAILIATPLLTGPGMISTIIVLSQQVGQVTTGLAALVALLLAYAILYLAPLLRKAVGDKTIEAFSKIMGLVLLALAVEFIRTGLAG